jgi:hypothetical protein
MIAGIVVASCEYLLDSFVFAGQWDEAVNTLKSPYFSRTTIIASFQILGFAAGVIALRLYAAMSPRRGSGRRTALRAALYGWSLTYLPVCAALSLWKPIPALLVGIVAATALGELVAGASLGCWIYEESCAATLRATGGSRLIEEP